ncbi:YybH family protein [Kitasatospora sp. NPDC056181]|uniref:YybH family protein n=1 Tax=Kitasatospora sp. NPDC056181 TaxID=3345737 RepID=UPI0035D5A931
MTHEATVTLTTDPGQHPAVFAAAFGTGDPAAVQRVYEPGGVFVPAPGTAVTGPELAAANAEFLALGLPITVRPRHTYVADDIALLIVDWSISGTTPDGEDVHLEGTATDVARRGKDGRWRYVIDNPFGTAGAPEATHVPGAPEATAVPEAPGAAQAPGAAHAPGTAHAPAAAGPA